jgi:uncharacterized protein YkwD
MLRSTVIACAIAALAVCGLGTAGASAKSKSARAGACTGAYAIAVDAATLQRANDAVLCLVNRERAARGVGSVRAAGPLTSASTAHSAEMVANKYFSHAGLNGDDVYARVTRAGYNWRAAGEAIIWGAGRSATPFKLVTALLKSAAHRPIMLDRSYRELGVGLVLGGPTRNATGSASTLTLDFGSR